MSSGRDEYRTPPGLFKGLHREFRFAHDLAATADNALTPRFSAGPCVGSPATCSCGLHAGLAIPRGSAIWCNPPYSELGPWLTRFAALGEYVPVVAVLPVATTSRWWWSTLAETAHELRFPAERIQFLHDAACTCKSCQTGDRASNRGENVIAVWLPIERPPGGPVGKWGWRPK